MKPALIIALISILLFGACSAEKEEILGKNPVETQASESVAALIVPHHLVAKNYTDKAFLRVKELMEKGGALPDRIILMGPDDFFRGMGKISVSDKKWQTTEGEILPDSDLISALINGNFAKLEPEAAERDHSLTAVLPFIKKYFPNAKVAALLMREPFTEEEAKKLAFFLQEEIANGGKKTLIVASIDFSHYLPKSAADFHDEASLVGLKNLDQDFFQKNIDADSPHILMTLAEYLNSTKNGNAAHFTLLSHTNSAEIAGNIYEKSTTSHIIGYFGLADLGRETVSQITVTLLARDKFGPNPLMKKGSDFIVDSDQIRRGAPFIAQKNGLKIGAGYPEDRMRDLDEYVVWQPENGTAGVIVKKENDRIKTRICFFNNQKCI